MPFFYEDVLTALQRAGVRYVLVGGVAVILHGVPRTTADLDLVVDLDEGNLGRLVDALTNLGFRPRAPVPATDLIRPEKRREWIDEKGMKAFSFRRPDRPLDEVDILIDSPLSYSELDRNAEALTAEGLVLRVASELDLIRMKEGTAVSKTSPTLTHCGGCSRSSVADDDRRGVSHHHSLEKLLAFRAVPTVDKLRWLEEMRLLLERFLTPERRELMERFRRGEL